MKSLSRILAICLCSAPIIHGALAVVATNSGSNLTAFNPSNAYNNQWATMSNGRSDAVPTAKVNFGNCNSVILRCAQPKCSNGGCTDMNVASLIVSGCVKSNKSCEQYGEDLISTMAAQLVANSNAKINAQNAAAAQAAQAAQQEQINAMQQQMQQQMAQMQQQMAEQNAQMQQQNEQTQQQIQAALDQQAQQNQAALDNMASAATANANAQMEESGITSYQQEAIDRGIPEDVLERKKFTGQIMTEIEDAEISMKAAKTAMNNAFEYAHCDTRGNNCTGPKRVKKFRELALGFIDPYDTVIDKIYDAIEDAQMVGVDLSEIYMMLDDSCNRWGEYLCPQGMIVYDDSGNNNTQKGAPYVCDDTLYQQCLTQCQAAYILNKNNPLISASANTILAQCNANCVKPGPGSGNCKRCTLMKVLTEADDIYKGWINAETTSTENQTVVACASGALDNSRVLRRARRKRGAGTVTIDLDQFERWLSQVEPSNMPKDPSTKQPTPDVFKEYCGVEPGSDEETDLRKSMLSKTLIKNRPLCVDPRGSNKSPADPEECPYINKIYALCDTHMYNANRTDPKDLKTDSSLRPAMKEIIALKTTVVSQQMYKQYEFLSATLRRLKTHLEKSVLSANLQAAGGFSGGGSSSGSSSSVDDDDKHVQLSGATNCSGIMDFDQFVECLQSNVSLIKTHANSSNTKEACVQLQYTLDEAHNRFTMEGYDGVSGTTGGKWSYCKNYFGVNTGTTWSVNPDKTCRDKKKQNIINCANEIISRASVVKKARKPSSGGWFIPGGGN